jgi:hypothetical protein
VAQHIKEPSPVPDKCPSCRTPLYCPTRSATPLHRPYPKQTIEQLFHKYVNDEPGKFYGLASEVRNLLLHGEEVPAIEARCGIEFSQLVNKLGHLAYIAIFNQFVPVLVNKKPSFLRASHFVHMNMSGVAHMQIGFLADLNNPNPAQFPKVEMSLVPSSRTSESTPSKS